MDQKKKDKGFPCHLCKEFYASEPDANTCRHRNETSTTPPSFWDTNFPDSQEIHEKKLMLNENDPLLESAKPKWMKKKSDEIHGSTTGMRESDHPAEESSKTDSSLSSEHTNIDTTIFSPPAKKIFHSAEANRKSESIVLVMDSSASSGANTSGNNSEEKTGVSETTSGTSCSMSDEKISHTFPSDIVTLNTCDSIDECSVIEPTGTVTYDCILQGNTITIIKDASSSTANDTGPDIIIQELSQLDDGSFPEPHFKMTPIAPNTSSSVKKKSRKRKSFHNPSEVSSAKSNIVSQKVVKKAGNLDKTKEMKKHKTAVSHNQVVVLSDDNSSCEEIVDISSSDDETSAKAAQKSEETTNLVEHSAMDLTEAGKSKSQTSVHPSILNATKLQNKRNIKSNLKYVQDGVNVDGVSDKNLIDLNAFVAIPSSSQAENSVNNVENSVPITKSVVSHSNKVVQDTEKTISDSKNAASVSKDIVSNQNKQRIDAVKTSSDETDDGCSESENTDARNTVFHLHSVVSSRRSATANSVTDSNKVDSNAKNIDCPFDNKKDTDITSNNDEEVDDIESCSSPSLLCSDDFVNEENNSETLTDTIFNVSPSVGTKGTEVQENEMKIAEPASHTNVGTSQNTAVQKNEMKIAEPASHTNVGTSQDTEVQENEMKIAEPASHTNVGTSQDTAVQKYEMKIAEPASHTNVGTSQDTAVQKNEMKIAEPASHTNVGISLSLSNSSTVKNNKKDNDTKARDEGQVIYKKYKSKHSGKARSIYHFGTASFLSELLADATKGKNETTVSKTDNSGNSNTADLNEPVIASTEVDTSQNAGEHTKMESSAKDDVVINPNTKETNPGSNSHQSIQQQKNTNEHKDSNKLDDNTRSKNVEDYSINDTVMTKTNVAVFGHDVIVATPADNNPVETLMHVDSTDIFQNFPECNFTNELKQLAASRKEFSTSYENYLRGCLWSPDGNAILTNSDDNILRVFSIPENIDKNTDVVELTASLRMSEGETIYDMAWYPFMNSADPDTCCFISTSRDHPIHLWDACTGRVRCSYRAFDQMDELASANSVAFNLDGSKIYCGFNKCVRVFDSSRPGREFMEIHTVAKKQQPRAGRHRFALKLNQPGIISTIAFSKEYNGMFALGSFAKSIGLYSTHDSKLLHVLNAEVDGHHGGVTQVKYSDDGLYLFSGGRKDRELICWDMRNTTMPLFKLLRTVDTNQRIQFDIDRSGCHVVSGDTNNIVNVWNLNDIFNNITDEVMSHEPTHRFHTHSDAVNAVSLHPSKPLLASTSGQRHFIIDDSDSDSMEAETQNICIFDNSLRIWSI